MKGRRDRRIERIRSVERQFAVMQLAEQLLREQLRANPSLLQRHGLERRDFNQAIENLSATYLVRLFAEFESGLREAWRRRYGRKSHPKTGALLEAFAARCKVLTECRNRTDQVRTFRNALVHEEDETMIPVSIAEARGHLCRFFSFLPPDW